MNELTIGLLGALLATNQPGAVSNVIQQQTGLSVPVATSPADQELRELMIADDLAIDEVDGWISTNSIARTNTVARQTFNQRIVDRFGLVRQSYTAYLRNHPDSARGYLAYGSFLNEIGDEEEARVQYENSKQIDPKNPAVWNNLANYYGEHSPVTNAFAYYAQAIKLDPREPVYYQNFATTVYLFRKDAREFYRIDEQQVFDKALDLYRQAMQLEPGSLVLATDYAMSYYGIKPFRTNDALVAWTNALKTAHNDVEREGVELHLARTKINAGYFDQARAHLAGVTNDAYGELKRRLTRSLADHEHPSTNSVPEPGEDPLPLPTPVNTPAAVPAAREVPVLATNCPVLDTNLLTMPPPVRSSKPD